MVDSVLYKDAQPVVDMLNQAMSPFGLAVAALRLVVDLRDGHGLTTALHLAHQCLLWVERQSSVLCVNRNFRNFNMCPTSLLGVIRVRTPASQCLE